MANVPDYVLLGGEVMAVNSDLHGVSPTRSAPTYGTSRTGSSARCKSRSRDCRMG